MKVAAMYLRRLLRRAIRFAMKLGINDPFMYNLVPSYGRNHERLLP